MNTDEYNEYTINIYKEFNDTVHTLSHIYINRIQWYNNEFFFQK